MTSNFISAIRAAILAGASIFSCPQASAAEADREVAVWAGDMGGFAQFEGDRRRIRDVADLPDKDFRIEVLNLVGANIDPPHMEADGAAGASQAGVIVSVK